MRITKEEVAQAVRDWIGAFNRRDLAACVIDAEGVGYGYRTIGARDMSSLGIEGNTRLLGDFFARCDSFRTTLEQVETAVTGEDLGLAWGVFVEDFQEKGRPPERARVRFSQVMRKTADGWKILLFHRDIQPFGEDGRYPRELTTIQTPSQTSDAREEKHT